MVSTVTATAGGVTEAAPPDRPRRARYSPAARWPWSGAAQSSTARQGYEMQLGMIGLGRMGANMVRRLMTAGHECVVFDVSADAVRPARGRRRHGRRRRSRTSWPSWPRRARLADGAGRLRGRRARRPSQRCSQPGDIVIDGGNSYYHDDIRRAATLKPAGIHYVDVGTSGGVWGLERGYCLMIGGEDDVGRPARPDLPGAGPGRRHHRPHARAQRRPDAGRAGLPPLRPERRRPLREDGAQRDRVRAHGGLRRGPQHPPPRRRRPRTARAGRRDDAAAPPRALPVRARPHRHRRGVAAGQRHQLLAAGPDRPGVRAGPRADELRRAGVGLGRGPLDQHRRHRRGRARPRPERRRCSSGSARGARPTSPTRCCRPCASASAGTSRRRT